MRKIIKKIIETDNHPIQKILNEKSRIYTFLNPVSYLLAKSFNIIFHGFDGIFADGSILSTSIKLYSIKGVKRRSFDMTSFAPIVLNYAEKSKKTICFIGANKTDNDKAMCKLIELYPKIQIIGSRDGFFKNINEREKAILNIINLNPDYLIIGMGTPIQEKFLYDVKIKGYKGIGFTCGGFIHQVANYSIHFYPKLIDQFNIRWIYRFVKEKHTRKRYIKTAFIFPFIFVLDRFTKESYDISALDKEKYLSNKEYLKKYEEQRKKQEEKISKKILSTS